MSRGYNYDKLDEGFKKLLRELLGLQSRMSSYSVASKHSLAHYVALSLQAISKELTYQLDTDEWKIPINKEISEGIVENEEMTLEDYRGDDEKNLNFDVLDTVRTKLELQMPHTINYTEIKKLLEIAEGKKIE